MRNLYVKMRTLTSRKYIPITIKKCTNGLYNFWIANTEQTSAIIELDNKASLSIEITEESVKVLDNASDFETVKIETTEGKIYKLEVIQVLKSACKADDIYKEGSIDVDFAFSKIKYKKKATNQVIIIGTPEPSPSKNYKKYEAKLEIQDRYTGTSYKTITFDAKNKTQARKIAESLADDEVGRQGSVRVFVVYVELA